MTGLKTGGRQKGTLNKITFEAREALKKILIGEITSGRLQEALLQLPEEKYLLYFIKLSAFIFPQANNANTLEDITPPANHVDEKPAMQQTSNSNKNTGKNEVRMSPTLQHLQQENKQFEEKMRQALEERLGRDNPLVKLSKSITKPGSIK